VREVIGDFVIINKTTNMAVLFSFVAGVGVGYILRVQIGVGLMSLRSWAEKLNTTPTAMTGQIEVFWSKTPYDTSGYIGDGSRAVWSIQTDTGWQIISGDPNDYKSQVAHGNYSSEPTTDQLLAVAKELNIDVEWRTVE
jgi:hypothetical protein